MKPHLQAEVLALEPTPENAKIYLYFHSAYSFICIHSPDALAELERRAAEYKLFRSLTLLFLLDIPLAGITASFSWCRLWTSLGFVG